MSFKAAAAGRRWTPFNALLSFVYTLLCHDIAAALSSVGLDPYVGFCIGTGLEGSLWLWI